MGAELFIKKSRKMRWVFYTHNKDSSLSEIMANFVIKYYSVATSLVIKLKVLYFNQNYYRFRSSGGHTPL